MSSNAPARPGVPPARAPQTALIATRALVFVLSLLPFLHLLRGALTDGLGANPLEYLTQQTGTWTFNFLLLTLTITPLRQLTGMHWLIRLRRMLGLFCFFYAMLHFSAWLWFEHFFALEAMARDILKRPFITVGFVAFTLLLPLAATSSQYAQRRLGGRRWQALHRSIYLIGILACMHYFWLVKITAIVYPLTYAILLAVLLGWRARDRIARYHGPPGHRLMGK